MNIVKLTAWAVVWVLNMPISFAPDSSQTHPPLFWGAIWAGAVWCQLASGPESSPWPILFAGTT